MSTIYIELKRNIFNWRHLYNIEFWSSTRISHWDTLSRFSKTCEKLYFGLIPILQYLDILWVFSWQLFSEFRGRITVEILHNWIVLFYKDKPMKTIGESAIPHGKFGVLRVTYPFISNMSDLSRNVSTYVSAFITIPLALNQKMYWIILYSSQLKRSILFPDMLCLWSFIRNDIIL